MNRNRPFRNFAIGLIALFAIPGLLAQTGDPIEKNKQLLMELTPEKKAELKRKKEQFDRLPEVEKERIRRIHREITSMDEDRREHLLAVLRDYHEWLKGLSAKQRAQLRSMPIEQRVAEIKQLRLEEEQKNFGIEGQTKLPDEDEEELRKWFAEVINLKRESIAKLSKGNFPRRVSRDMLSTIVLLQASEQDFSSIVVESDIENLSQNLSAAANKILETNDTHQRKAVLVQRWVTSAMMSRFQRVSDEELQWFYDTVLKTEEREELDRLSPSSWRRRLKEKYWRSFRRVDDNRLNRFYDENLNDQQREEIDKLTGQDRRRRLMSEYFNWVDSNRNEGPGRGGRGGDRGERGFGDRSSDPDDDDQ